MNRKDKILFLFFTLHFLLCALTYSQNKYQLPGVELYGMNALSIVKDEAPFSILRNPAAISQSNKSVFSFDYSLLFSGLSKENNLFGYYPPDIYAFGFGWKLPLENPGIVFTWSGLHTEPCSNDEIEIALSIPIKKRRIGLGLKIYSNTFRETPDLAVFFRKNGNTSTSINLDLGLVEPLRENYYLGLSLKNLIPVSAGLFYEDLLPLSYSISSGARFESYLFAVEVNSRADDGKIGFSGGFELSPFGNMFSVRIGGNESSVTTGFSFEKDFLKLNYGANYPYKIYGTILNHKVEVSISY